MPGEIQHVIGDDCRVTDVYGAVFPVLWRFFHRFPQIFVPFEKIAYYAPINRISHRVFYRVVNLPMH
jgi:hypothetical protein